MTSKEEKYEEWRRYFFEVDKEMYKYFTRDLELSEALEKTNIEKDKIITDLLKGKKVLKEENEKLKKAIEIIKNKLELEFNLDEYWKGVHYHLWCENGCEITKQEYELLNEVLGND